MDIFSLILGLLFLMGGSVQSMSLGWEEASLTGGNDVDWEGHGTKFENTSADQEMRFPSRSGSDENWIETWQDDKETVLLEPGETASFSFTFGNQPTTKYVEYRISSPRALSASHSSLVFTCEMKPLQNSSDCRGGKVKIGYRQKTLRLCNKTHSLRNEMAGDLLRIWAENTLPSNRGNIRCRILATSCGKRNVKRIISGTETLPHEYPWQVGLVYNREDPTPYCGGSIIGPYHILTAAHCLYIPKQMLESAFHPLVVVGMHDFRKPPATAKYLKIAEMILHPEYVNKTFANDIAILKMEQPIPFDVKNTVSPVCLPEDPNNKYDNVEVIVCGWGDTKAGNKNSHSPVLLHTVTTTMANPSCNKVFFPFKIVRDDQICLQNSGKGQGLFCHGDSGGPLMYQHGTHVDQIAIVSHMNTECIGGYPTIFTRVTSYLDWIRSHIGRP
ncbi:brachyurin-like isoform X2 [Macrobrachium rosenbergii]|uniref:brachyurin-like isoform X2 n=1 Tax=Macrobrachium rosenbergii TaxID=79674 RepID=UPI0034D59E77